MKKRISPASAIAIIVVALVILIGVGYYLSSGGSGSTNPLPPAHSRAEMIQNLRARGVHASGPNATERRSH